MTELSDRQRAILAFIRQYQGEHSAAPTLREIGRVVGISSTSVTDYNLRVLERDGYLRRERERSRAIELAGQGEICEHCGGTGRVQRSCVDDRTLAAIPAPAVRA